MKIDIPCEIGDPIIQIKYDWYHDEYYLDYHGLCHADLENVNMIFSDYKTAKAKLHELNSKENSKNFTEKRIK